MSVRSFVTSIVTRIAMETGYPAIVRTAYNALKNKRQVDIAADATVGRGVNLGGEIEIASGAKVIRGSQLKGTITIDAGARVGPDSRIDGRVTIGRGTNLTEGIEVLAARDRSIAGAIQIGKYNAIARGTTFQNRYHVTSQPGVQSKFYHDKFGTSLGERSNGPLNVGSDVWIGLDTVVLSGVEIGHGAIIGAGAVVTRDIPPYAIVAGVPAEPIGWRFDEPTREQLLDIEWWEWDDEMIHRNEEFFRTDLEGVSDVHGLIAR